MPDIKMLFAYTRDRSVVLPDARPGDYHTRLVDLDIFAILQKPPKKF